MCNVCENVKTEKNINAMIGLIELAEKGEFDKACVPGLQTYLGSLSTDEWSDDPELVIARALGQPEPELYQDNPIPTYDDGDTEAHLNALLTIDGRLKKGLSMIHELDATINNWFTQHKWFWKLYISWRKDTDPSYQIKDNHLKILSPSVRGRFLNDKRNGVYLGTFTRRADLWKHWHMLNNEKKKIVEANPRVWPAYYQLMDSELTQYFTFDQEVEAPIREKVTVKANGEIKVEEQLLPDNRMMETDEAYALSHQEEKQQLILI